jgi:predicted transcriptional regulator
MKMSRKRIRGEDLFDDRMEAIRTILRYLDSAPTGVRYTPLLSLCIGGGIGISAFEKARKWTLEKSYIVKPERGLYKITPRGKKLLESLNKI